MKYLMIYLLTLNFAFSDSKWKQVLIEDGIIVESKENSSGLMAFRASGTIDGSPDLVLSILKDHNKKHQWAPKLKTVRMHKYLGNEEYIFSEYYQTPWPSTDREFLLKGKILKTESSYLLKAKSIEAEKLAAEDHIQAAVEYINIELKPTQEKNTNIKFEFQGDMKGWIPLWLTNLIQKKWPLRFIQGLKKRTSEMI